MLVHRSGLPQSHEFMASAWCPCTDPKPSEDLTVSLFPVLDTRNLAIPPGDDVHEGDIPTEVFWMVHRVLG